MLIDQIAASLPTENVLERTYERRVMLSQNYLSKRPSYMAKKMRLKAVRGPGGVLFKPFTDAWMEQARKALNASITCAKVVTTEPLTEHEILEYVAQKHGVEPHRILSPTRRQNVMLARRECYYLLREMSLMSFKEIARFLGDKDHSSVHRGYIKHKEFLAQEGGKE